MAERNDTSIRAVWWILAVLFMGFAAVTSVLFTGLNGNIERNRGDIAMIVGNQQIYRERIVALEAKAAAQGDLLLSIKADLDYIKKRVDAL